MSGSVDEQRFLAASHRVGDDLLVVLHDACEAMGIEYCIFYGTLLGAVREGGWIPWDDDIDVAMHRDQFERFRASVDAHLPDWVAFSDTRTDLAHLTSIPRLLDLRTDRLPSSTHRRREAPEVRHVALDIFVLDQAPSSAKTHALWRRMVRVTEKAVVAAGSSPRAIARDRKRSVKDRVTQVALACLARPLGHRRLSNLHRRAATAFAETKTGLVSISNGWTLRTRRLTFTQAELRPIRPIAFGQLSVSGPADPDAVLRSIYGEYSTPPTAENRRPIHFRDGLRVKFDDGEIVIDPSGARS